MIKINHEAIRGSFPYQGHRERLMGWPSPRTVQNLQVGRHGCWWGLQVCWKRRWSVENCPGQYGFVAFCSKPWKSGSSSRNMERALYRWPWVPRGPKRVRHDRVRLRCFCVGREKMGEKVVWRALGTLLTVSSQVWHWSGVLMVQCWLWLARFERQWIWTSTWILECKCNGRMVRCDVQNTVSLKLWCRLRWVVRVVLGIGPCFVLALVLNVSVSVRDRVSHVRPMSSSRSEKSTLRQSRIVIWCRSVTSKQCWRGWNVCLKYHCTWEGARSFGAKSHPVKNGVVAMTHKWKNTEDSFGQAWSRSIRQPAQVKVWRVWNPNSDHQKLFTKLHAKRFRLSTWWNQCDFTRYDSHNSIAWKVNRRHFRNIELNLTIRKISFTTGVKQYKVTVPLSFNPVNTWSKIRAATAGVNSSIVSGCPWPGAKSKIQRSQEPQARVSCAVNGRYRSSDQPHTGSPMRSTSERCRWGESDPGLLLELFGSTVRGSRS